MGHCSAVKSNWSTGRKEIIVLEIFQIRVEKFTSVDQMSLLAITSSLKKLKKNSTKKMDYGGFVPGISVNSLLKET